MILKFFSVHKDILDRSYYTSNVFGCLTALKRDIAELVGFDDQFDWYEIEERIEMCCVTHVDDMSCEIIEVIRVDGEIVGSLAQPLLDKNLNNYVETDA